MNKYGCALNKIVARKKSQDHNVGQFQDHRGNTIFDTLKKLVIIILLMQFGSDHCLAGDLLRIPALLAHYHHHMQNQHDVSGFFHFLNKHYGTEHAGPRHQHGEHEEDCKLPFKHCGDGHVNAHHYFTGSLPPAGSFREILQSGILSPVEDEDIRSLHFCNIWQPPKAV